MTHEEDIFFLVYRVEVLSYFVLDSVSFWRQTIR
jgi:hypothetical protein